jgi:hypothetical protein
MTSFHLEKKSLGIRSLRAGFGARSQWRWQLPRQNEGSIKTDSRTPRERRGAIPIDWVQGGCLSLRKKVVEYARAHLAQYGGTAGQRLAEHACELSEFRDYALGIGERPLAAHALPREFPAGDVTSIVASEPAAEGGQQEHLGIWPLGDAWAPAGARHFSIQSWTLELSRLEATRYHKISHNPIAIERLMVDLFLDAHKRAPMP